LAVSNFRPEITTTPKSFPDFLSLTRRANPFRFLESKDVEWFTYPLGVQKASSEIIGGGILGEDLHTIRGYSGAVAGSQIGNPAALQTVFWRGWYNPTNLWTVTAGGSYQITPTTKISASYWYWGTSEDVPVSYVFETETADEKFQMSSSIGHELNFYLDQKIVDGLTLTLVGAYLFADDAFAPLPVTAPSGGLPLNSAGTATKLLADDAFEVGARLQWNF